MGEVNRDFDWKDELENMLIKKEYDLLDFVRKNDNKSIEVRLIIRNNDSYSIKENIVLDIEYMNSLKFEEELKDYFLLKFNKYIIDYNE